MSALRSTLPEKYTFRLFVAGDAANSMQAISNLRAICAANVPGRCSIEVVDVFREPGRALADSIFMTPTLVMLAPGPSRRIVGSLSQTQDVMDALGIAPVPS